MQSHAACFSLVYWQHQVCAVAHAGRRVSVHPLLPHTASWCFQVFFPREIVWRRNPRPEDGVGLVEPFLDALKVQLLPLFLGAAGLQQSDFAGLCSNLAASSPIVCGHMAFTHRWR